MRHAHRNRRSERPPTARPRVPPGAFAALALTLAAVPRTAPAALDDVSPRPLRPDGVTPTIEAAIDRGLRFLADTQQRDGSWGKSARETPGLETYPTAMTSLAGLCFLAAGSTPTRGPWSANVRAARDYLLRSCAAPAGSANTSGRIPGLLYNPQEREERPMYCHAFAMTFLSQVLPHEPDRGRRERIRRLLRDGVRLLARCQSDDGGWGYRPDYHEDEGTLVVTQLVALRSCRDAGIAVPRAIVDDAVRFIEHSTNADGSVRYRTGLHEPVRPGVTCAALVALWNAGRHDEPLFRRISDYVQRRIAPVGAREWYTGHHAEYVVYFMAQSQHVLGGSIWHRFYADVAPLLLEYQQSDGSWEGRDRGDVYGTVVALLVLQLPYERLTVYQR